ncbi:MAG: nucleotidyltransferase family protein, partial [Lachnospiraceae bacterium]|nr:nucleotidyltransferase family protein [Lachnospiraceae bacterium]
MKIAAVICELNPLHSGHARLFRCARDMGADCVLAVMSGDFVQRGEPAVMNRRTRARMALNAGADMVLSYPVRYATGSAERFASYAVRIADGLGCVDSLVFGSESGSLAELEKCARILADEPAFYRERLREALKMGKSYPAARAEALPEFSDLLREPNNILGVEYLK